VIALHYASAIVRAQGPVWRWPGQIDPALADGILDR
jgi:hypothetical protein